MLSRLFEYVGNSTLEGETVSINLMAAKGRESFYEQLGFISRPTEDKGAGMSMYFKNEAKELIPQTALRIRNCEAVPAVRATEECCLTIC